MKKYTAALCLLLLLLSAALRAAAGEQLVVYLSGEALDATSIGINWLCTDKEDPAFTIDMQVQGVDRSVRMKTYDTYFSINHLYPGTPYVITVSSETGGSQTITVTTPAAEPFTDYSYALKATGLYKSYAGSREYTELSSLNSQTLPGEIYDYDFHFMFRFLMMASRAQKSETFELMLRLPNGDAYALSDILWYGKRTQTHTQYYAFTELLKEVLADYGAFPTGEYTLTACFVGKLAAQMTFMME